MVLQRHPWLLAAPLLLTALLACAGSGEEPTAGPDQLVRVPADFPPLPVPEDNALTPERVELGRRLFFDKRLSRTQEIACGSCHLQDYRGQKQVPRLTNQREDYLVAAMKAYRDNKRTGADTSMNAVLYQVPDSEIQALAHYLANVSDKSP